jgi:tetratricopeptide (TPR) repeat protein
MDVSGFIPGFDDPGAHRLYWVNQFLDVEEEPDTALVAMIVELRPVEELVDALQSDDAMIRARATQMLWHLWLYAEGDLAYDELLYGMDLMEDEHWDDAIACFDKLIENLPNFAEAYNKRATCYYLMGEYECSIRDALTTVKLNPYHFGAWNGLGSCYIALQEWDRALVSLRRAQRLQPYAEENVRLMAYCRERLKAAAKGPRRRKP